MHNEYEAWIGGPIDALVGEGYLGNATVECARKQMRIRVADRRSLGKFLYKESVELL